MLVHKNKSRQNLTFSLAVTIWTYMQALAATRRPRILIIHTYIKAHIPIYIIAHNPHMSIGKNKYFDVNQLYVQSIYFSVFYNRLLPS